MNRAANIFNRIRIEWLSHRYTQWLELFGMTRRERKAARLELVANMISASQELGYRQARNNIGDLRIFAKTQAEPIIKRMSFERGILFATTVFAVYVILAVTGIIFLTETLTQLQEADALKDPATASFLLAM